MSEFASNPLLTLAVVAAAGLFGGILAKKLHLPSVTGQVLAGVAISDLQTELLGSLIAFLNVWSNDSRTECTASLMLRSRSYTQFRPYGLETTLESANFPTAGVEWRRPCSETGGGTHSWWCRSQTELCFVGSPPTQTASVQQL